MKRQIVRFSVGQSSKVVALLYGVFGLIFVPIGILLALLDRERMFPTFLLGFYLCAPFIYAVLGYVFSLIGFWFYNLIAGGVGGIEFELKDLATGETAEPSLPQPALR